VGIPILQAGLVPCPPPVPVPSDRGKGSFDGPGSIKPGRELWGDRNQAAAPGLCLHALDVDEPVPDVLPSDPSRFIRTESAEQHQGNPRRQPGGMELGGMHQGPCFLGGENPGGLLVEDRGQSGIDRFSDRYPLRTQQVKKEPKSDR